MLRLSFKVSNEFCRSVVGGGSEGEGEELFVWGISKKKKTSLASMRRKEEGEQKCSTRKKKMETKGNENKKEH